MTVYVDNPHTRAQTECPLCGGFADLGLVTCWQCYRKHDLRYTGDREQLIADFEVKQRKLYWAKFKVQMERMRSEGR